MTVQLLPIASPASTGKTKITARNIASGIIPLSPDMEPRISLHEGRIMAIAFAPTDCGICLDVLRVLNAKSKDIDNEIPTGRFYDISPTSKLVLMLDENPEHMVVGLYGLHISGADPAVRISDANP